MRRGLLATFAALAVALATPVLALAPTQKIPHRPPHRIVSLNACADAYLIALADKSQVAALTRYARDPMLSFYAEEAKSWPITGGAAEALLVLHPDLVITTPFHRADQLTLLRGHVPVVELEPARDFEDVIAQTRLIAKTIGHPERGEALVRSMQARVDAAGRRPVNGVAAHYERGGYITGKASLEDDLMTRAGLVNLARRGAALGRMSLEEIVQARPDYLIVNEAPRGGQDEGALIFDHPALAHAVSKPHRLMVPEALTVCGGPSYPAAVERLQAEADRARRLSPERHP